jgi:hypothetical protein
MKRILAVSLAAVFVLSALSSGSAFAAPKANLQIGFGANQIQAAPMMGLDWKNPMLYAAGMYFPSSWSVLIADISYGLENEYEQTEGTDTEKFKGQSGYADFMFGAVKHFTDGGFLYASLGAAVGWASVEMSDRDGEITIDTGAGAVFGAGMQIPIRNTFMGFANFKQRCVPTEIHVERTESSDYTSTFNAGGFEMTVGVAWTFGEK